MRSVPIFLVMLSAAAWAGTIDTSLLEQPWPKERVREFEVGRYPVRWRERASKQDGIFAGIRFEAPLERRAMWDRAVDYRDIGTMTPGVTAVRVVEESEKRQLIQIDAKILWKTLALTFEVEREPPSLIRFRLTNQALGEYRGVCRFAQWSESTAGKTTVDMATWLKPARPVPMGLLLIVERITLLQGVKRFLEECEEAARR